MIILESTYLITNSAKNIDDFEVEAVSTALGSILKGVLQTWKMFEVFNSLHIVKKFYLFVFNFLATEETSISTISVRGIAKKHILLTMPY